MKEMDHLESSTELSPTKGKARAKYLKHKKGKKKGRCGLCASKKSTSLGKQGGKREKKRARLYFHEIISQTRHS